MTSRRIFLGGLAASALVLPASLRAQQSPSACEVPTTADIEGPYYRPGIVAGTQPFEGRGHLIFEGTIRNTRCEPLPAFIELWQANHQGHYDNDGTTEGHFGRAAQSTMGEYRFVTTRPGHYLNGSAYRPAHLHVKVRAPGYVPLTTQLYFPGDPYNAQDPFFHRSRLLTVQQDDPRMHVVYEHASFDFILQPLAR
jgi:catechol 1,2-dioxygenase